MTTALVDKPVFDCQGMPQALRSRFLRAWEDSFHGNNSIVNFYCGEREADDEVHRDVEAWVRANAPRELGEFEDVIILVWW